MNTYLFVFFKNQVIVSTLLIAAGVLTHFCAIAEPPIWTINPPDYQYTMTSVIRIKNANNTFLNNDETMLRTIVGGETRGVVNSDEIIFIGDDAYFPLTIFSNITAGELLNFEVYVSEVDTVFAANETAIFNRNLYLGTPGDPFILNLSFCKPILILTEADLPLQKEYKAGLQIFLIGSFSLITDTLHLRAPEVFCVGATDVSIDSQLTVQATGCN